MQKTGMILMMLGVFVATSTGASEQGVFLFESHGCSSCHGHASGSNGFPALPELGQAYKGKQKQLILYLEGEIDPIVQPEKSGMMRRQLEKTKAMSDSDREAMADFIVESLTPKSRAGVKR
jgi:cytochrome c